MSSTPRSTLIRRRRHRSVEADHEGRPPGRRWPVGGKGGLLAAVTLVLSCGVTTALVAGGALAAGGQLSGRPGWTVAALLALLLLFAWHGRAHLRRRRKHPEPPVTETGAAVDRDGPYVCTLDDEDVPARTRQIRQLAGGLRSEQRSPGLVRLRFAPELAEVVRGFVRDESDCCSFFTFAIDELADEVQLTVSAPDEAQPLLDGLHEVLVTPDEAGEDGSEVS